MKLERTRYPGVYRRRGRYEIAFKDSDGKWHRKQQPKGTTALQASEMRSQLVSKVSRGERVVPSRLTVREAYNQWMSSQQHRLKERTVATYSEKLTYYAFPMLQNRRLQDVTVNDVAALIAQMQKDGRKAWTIRGTLVPLSRLFSWCVREGLILSNPVQQLERWEKPQTDQREPQVLSTEEVKKFLEASGNYRSLFTTLVFSGMRSGELLSLTWSDIDFENGLLSIKDSKTKAGVRKVVMVSPVRKELAAWKLQTGHLSDISGNVPNVGNSRFVFLPNQTQKLRDKQRFLLRVFNRTLKEAGIHRKLTVHDLRHTFASILIHQGHDAAFIAAQMGHASVATTYRVYGHLFDREKKEAEMRRRFEADFG